MLLGISVKCSCFIKKGLLPAFSTLFLLLCMASDASEHQEGIFQYRQNVRSACLTKEMS